MMIVLLPSCAYKHTYNIPWNRHSLKNHLVNIRSSQRHFDIHTRHIFFKTHASWTGTTDLVVLVNKLWLQVINQWELCMYVSTPCMYMKFMNYLSIESCFLLSSFTVPTKFLCITLCMWGHFSSPSNWPSTWSNVIKRISEARRRSSDEYFIMSHTWLLGNLLNI